ncbi:hypothetical protein CHUV0807_0995 [Cardiobacterium hominis]|uniref:Uncharacterized protein n=1 Tax=Cardiobacterium hominis TaxID=2718 RepID=A0A1C3H3Q4_9GAMM|nr:hypothetical protein [Cardiobacterium hominis]SAM62262.1 hypothetical protein CHUV0807_0995 [Cardiobacterium hominis]
MCETVITLAAAAVSAVLAIIASKLLVNRRHQQVQAVMAVVLFLAFTAIAQALYQNFNDLPSFDEQDARLLLAAAVVSALIAGFTGVKLIERTRREARRLTITALFLPLFCLLSVAAFRGWDYWQDYYREWLFSPLTAAEIDRDLQQNEVMRVWKAEAAEEYQELLTQLEREKIPHLERNSQRTFALADKLRGKALAQRIARVSNDSVHQFMSASIRQLKVLQAHDPAQCFAVLFPDSGIPVNFALLQEANKQSGINAAQIAILRDKTPYTPQDVSDADKEALVARISEELRQRHGDSLALLESAEGLQSVEGQTLLCAITIENMEMLDDPADPVKMAFMRQMFFDD